jgi:hypothetical protein
MLVVVQEKSRRLTYTAGFGNRYHNGKRGSAFLAFLPSADGCLSLVMAMVKNGKMKKSLQEKTAHFAGTGLRGAGTFLSSYFGLALARVV